ncbi:MAG: LruC domain-containing protein [Bacteroidales bacterium]|nr:LruC domain-containing protein [Bacteroidales bacterium]
MKNFNNCSRGVVLLLYAILAGVLINGCVKQPHNKIKPDDDELIIPAGFDWRTVKEINFVVSVISIPGVDDNLIRVIKIFKDAKMDDSQLIASGAAKPNLPYKSTISLATSLPVIYVQEILPDGGRNVKAVNITGSTVYVNFFSSISSEVAKMTKSSTPETPIAMNVVFIDADGDGVPLGMDIDDNDPEVAFASYFPSAQSWSTFAFEDMWPEQGDYDVNDIILGMRVTYFTNSSNMVSRLRVDYNLRAAGSTYNIGAAFQLDRVAASNIRSVTGRTLAGSSPFSTNANGAEAEVSLAVIPLFNNQRDMLSYPYFLNTVNGDHRATPDNHLLVSFNTPVQTSDLSIDHINLFIVSRAREREIHLPSNVGTSKFNASLANGFNVSESNKFKNKQGMMWAIMVPESFKYPSERSSILKAYPKFREWATSGGASSPNWYSPEVSGNIVMEFIYLASPQSVSAPQVSTASVSDISPNSAKVGGTVTSDGGASVFARGVCWKTSSGPTVNDNKLSSGTGTGSFEGYISGLTPGATYYIRAYATNEIGTSYGEERSFTISADPAPIFPGVSLQPVKIGGVWWAPVNAGYAPDRLYGLLYQWGRMYGQRGQGDVGGSFSNSAAPVSLEEGNLLANADRFFQGLKDWCTTYQAAWNISLYNPCPSGWRVPSGDELSALMDAGSSWVNAGAGGVDGLAGRWFGSDHAGARVNSTFLPAGGFRNISSSLSNRGVAGYYWPLNSEPDDVKNLYFTIDNPGQRFFRDKVNGYSVRCVKE